MRKPQHRALKCVTVLHTCHDWRRSRSYFVARTWTHGSFAWRKGPTKYTEVDLYQCDSSQSKRHVTVSTHPPAPNTSLHTPLAGQGVQLFPDLPVFSVNVEAHVAFDICLYLFAFVKFKFVYNWSQGGGGTKKAKNSSGVLESDILLQPWPFKQLSCSSLGWCHLYSWWQCRDGDDAVMRSWEQEQDVP